VCIYEAIEKAFDRLEKVDQWVIDGCYVVGRLVPSGVTRIFVYDLKTCTYNQ